MMLRVSLRIITILAMIVFVLLSAFVYGSIQRPMAIMARFLHIAPARIYGTRAPGVKVFTFNHPSFLDKYVLFQVFQDYCALARDMAGIVPGANYVMRRIGCVLVHKDGRQNTTQRVIQKLRTTTKPLVIATSQGIAKDEKIPAKLPTIAFRLQHPVQPIVIVYKGVPDEVIPDSLPKYYHFMLHPPSGEVQPHVFFLPPIDPSTFASVEECAQEVRKKIMYVLAYCRSNL